MTREQLYSAYLSWLDGENPLPQEQLFQFPLTNLDVSEDSASVVNRLYFVVPHFSLAAPRFFTFFEENTFRKDSAGDLIFSCSSFFTLT